MGVSRTSFIDTKRYPVCVQEGEGIPPPLQSGQLTLELCGSDSVHFVLKAVSKQSDFGL